MLTVNFNAFNMNNLSAQTDFENKVLNLIVEWYSSSETVEVQTSGSTGVPKVLNVEKKRMRHSAMMTCNFLGLQEGDSALVCLPVEYISGKMMIVRALERKLKLHVVNPSAKPLKELEQRVDFCAMSPLQVENSLDKIHLIKNLIIGGAQVSESLKHKISKNIPESSTSRIFETYGMSETLSHIALKQIYPEAEECFTVMDGVKISQDGRACLEIAAPSLTPSLLHTNDVVELQGPNRFKFVGRADNIINSGGLKIQPEQVESILRQYLDAEAVVGGVPDILLGQKLVVVVEGENTSEIKSGLIEAFKGIRTALSKNHVPKDVMFLSTFPRLPNGKINRRTILNEMKNVD